MSMEKRYDPKQIEQKWYKIWEQSDAFTPKPKDAQAYCIMIPPPNVTGVLHMGHAFQDTIMDALIRYHRMQGKQTLWQVGTDHAGIATQMVVERQLMAKEETRLELGRENFVSKIWDWKKQSGDNISQQLRRLGASVDWKRERFTLDEGLSQAVRKVFISLYREGLIYRGKKLVNWDPSLHTAVSDLEVISKEEKGFLWHIEYPVEGSQETLTIATTRPETLLGDTAVAIHPEDSRYTHLIGKFVRLPITSRLVPIIADDYVDPEFGTGCVKITPAHDFNDYEVGKRHQLEIINIFTVDAKLNHNAPPHLQNLDRFEARAKILDILKAENRLVKTEDHILKVPRCDKTNQIVEPFLTDQWFVKIGPLAEPAIQAVKNKEICFIPENWSKTYFDWMNNIQDWCISRQLWWGHRIPAWYDQDGNVYVGENEKEVRSHYQLSSHLLLKQDEDVLDTWFSSALWPFSTLGWPEKTKALETFYPTNVLVTGFDIIFFWVARMIMFGLKFTGQVPFKEVYIHGLIQDQDGQKMSKSKGNVIDPLDLIDGIELEALVKKRTSGMMQPHLAKSIEDKTRKQFKDGIPAYGTDALRFTFCSLATHGRHLRFELNRLESNRNFCNKLWNAARYVFMNIENHASDLISGEKNWNLADEWIQSKWQQAKQQIMQYFDSYRFDLAAKIIYEFTWNEYCDWYLELSKPILTNCNIAENNLRGTRYTLVYVLEEMLRVIHPIMPFITEEIWHMLSPLMQTQEKMLITCSYPNVNEAFIKHDVEQDVDWIKEFILGIRNIRGEMNISPKKPLHVLLSNTTDSDEKRLHCNLNYIQALATLEQIHIIKDGESIPPSAVALVGEMKIHVPLSDHINIDDEIQRLTKEKVKFEKELNKTQVKLANENYIQKAPQAVVEKEKARQQELEQLLSNINDSIERLTHIS